MFGGGNDSGEAIHRHLSPMLRVPYGCLVTRPSRIWAEVADEKPRVCLPWGGAGHRNGVPGPAWVAANPRTQCAHIDRHYLDVTDHEGVFATHKTSPEASVSRCRTAESTSSSLPAIPHAPATTVPSSSQLLQLFAFGQIGEGTTTSPCHW